MVIAFSFYRQALESLTFRAQLEEMTRRPDLDDPEYAAFAWTRFRRVLLGMTLLSLVCGVGAVAFLWWSLAEMPLHMAIATFLGVTLSVLLAAALMGLMFLSSGSGHDARVEDRSVPEELE